jgi:hypothetical protein
VTTAFRRSRLHSAGPNSGQLRDRTSNTPSLALAISYQLAEERIELVVGIARPVEIYPVQDIKGRRFDF